MNYSYKKYTTIYFGGIEDYYKIIKYIGSHSTLRGETGEHIGFAPTVYEYVESVGADQRVCPKKEMIEQ